MPAFQHIPLTIIEPFGPNQLLQQGAVVGNAPIWDGTKYAPLNPVSWFNAGVAQGRISEINIQGSGAFSSVVGNRATLTINAGAITVNGQAVTAINPGANMSASVSGGVATLNANTTSYVHPSYSPQSFEPFISGNQIVVPAIYTDSIGSTNNVIQRFLTLPTSSGGITGISVNGAGSYTDIQFAGNVSVSGNIVTVLGGGGGSTTLTHAGFGSPLFTGSSPSYTMKGIRSLSAGLTVSDTGQTLDFQLTGGSLVNVYNNGSFLGAFPGINFQGFPSVTSSDGLAVVTAPSGGGGASGVNVNGSGPFGNLTFTGAGVSVSGSTITIPGGSGGSAGINILNAGSAFMSGVTTLDIWNGTLQNIAPGFARLILPSGSGGGITGIQINSAGNYTGINFTGNVSVSGNTVNILGSGGGGSLTGVSGNGLAVTAHTVSLAMASTGTAGAMPALSGNVNTYLAGNGTWQVVPSGGGGGVTSLTNGTNTTAVNVGSGVWRVDATGLTGTSANGLTVSANSVQLALAGGVNPGAFQLPYSGQALSGSPIFILTNTHGGSASVMRLDAFNSNHVLEIVQKLDSFSGSVIVGYLGILVNGVRRKIALLPDL
jgi:hypothetical protein